MGTSTTRALALPGLATAAGGLGPLVVRRPTPQLLDTLAGLTGGILLAASMFGFRVPAIEPEGAHRGARRPPASCSRSTPPSRTPTPTSRCRPRLVEPPAALLGLADAVSPFGFVVAGR